MGREENFEANGGVVSLKTQPSIKREYDSQISLPSTKQAESAHT
jgi:hypothetical protein